MFFIDGGSADSCDFDVLVRGDEHKIFLLYYLPDPIPWVLSFLFSYIYGRFSICDYHGDQVRRSITVSTCLNGIIEVQRHSIRSIFLFPSKIYIFTFLPYTLCFYFTFYIFMISPLLFIVAMVAFAIVFLFFFLICTLTYLSSVITVFWYLYHVLILKFSIVLLSFL